VTLRHIAGGLAVGIDESTYVITSYLVANAVVLSISGWLSTGIGRQGFYMICGATFAFASLLCGFGCSLESPVLFRMRGGGGYGQRGRWRASGAASASEGWLAGALYRLRAGCERAGFARIRPRRGPAQGLVRVQHDPWVRACLRVLSTGADSVGIDSKGSHCRYPPVGTSPVWRLLPGDARHRSRADLDDAAVAATAANRTRIHRDAGW